MRADEDVRPRPAEQRPPQVAASPAAAVSAAVALLAPLLPVKRRRSACGVGARRRGGQHRYWDGDLFVAFVFYWSRHSDRTGERVGHATLSMLLGAAGLLASALLLQANPVRAMVALCFCAMGIFSAISPFWELPSAALAGAAAAGIALINSLGNLGGFVTPFAVGAPVDRTGDAKAGLFLLAGVLFVTAIATFLYGRRTGAGTVPTASHEDLLAKEAAAFELPADELRHRADARNVSDDRTRS